MDNTKDFEITDFASLHLALSNFREIREWIFRGQSDISWRVLPKVGRDEYAWVDDWQLFEAWRRRASAYVSREGISDWDWLAIAQHHGLATRLLDWTTNPLNATFFALREDRNSASVVYAARIKNVVHADRKIPKQSDQVLIFRPRAIVPRIVRQNGLFTFHGNPTAPLELNTSDVLEITRLIIPKNCKSHLLSELAFYGIHSETLFPDLDGLSEFLNWTVRTKEYTYLPISEARMFKMKKRQDLEKAFDV